MSDQGRIFRLNDRVEEKIFLFLIAAVVLTMPLKPASGWIVSLVLFVFWFFFQKKDLSFQSIRLRLSLQLTIFFVLSAVALLYTDNSAEGLLKLQNRSLLILFPLIFGTIRIDVNKTERTVTEIFIATFFLTGIFCLIVAFKNYLQDGNLVYFSGHPLVEWMMYPYVFAMNCLLAIIFLFEKFRNNSNSSLLFQSRKTIYFLIAFFTLFILAISIKLVIISWVIITLMYAYSLTKSKKHFLGSVALVFIAVLSAVLFVPALRHKVAEVFDSKENTIPLDVDASLGRDWNGIALRKAIWTCSLDAIRKHPWIGTGPGDTQEALQEAYEARKFYFASRYNTYHAHNQYLQLLLNFGVVGLILFIGMHVVIPIWRLRYSFVFVTFSLSVLLMFLTESMLEVNKGIFLYAFFSSFLIFTNTKSSAENIDKLI